MLSGVRRAKSKHLTTSTAHLVRSLDGARDDRAKDSFSPIHSAENLQDIISGHLSHLRHLRAIDRENDF